MNSEAEAKISDSINAEINSILDELEKAGEPVIPAWVTERVVSGYKDGVHEHSEFWRYCIYSEILEKVTRCINKRNGIDDMPVDESLTAEELTAKGAALMKHADELQKYKEA